MTGMRPKLRVQSFTVSLDGFGAGPGQDLQNPLGVNGPELMEWLLHTRMWCELHGEAGGEAGVDDGIAQQGFAGVGAWILGRNMFGPVRGPWPDESWQGWWGETPPYHTPVFVLTHHPRPPLRMAGGTEFRFVTEGIRAAAGHCRCGRPRRPAGRRSCHRPRVPSCRPGRRIAPRHPAGVVRLRRTPARWHRLALSRLRMRAVRGGRTRGPRLPAQEETIIDVAGFQMISHRFFPA